MVTGLRLLNGVSRPFYSLFASFANVRYWSASRKRRYMKVEPLSGRTRSAPMFRGPSLRGPPQKPRKSEWEAVSVPGQREENGHVVKSKNKIRGRGKKRINTSTTPFFPGEVERNENFETEHRPAPVLAAFSGMQVAVSSLPKTVLCPP